MPTTAFISYAHTDDARRERLHKHLAMLRRDGLLSEWSDHEILAGDGLDEDINAALNDAGLFIALLSADYLASNYCYEREFSRAQELKAAGKLRIVGVVVEPCDWKNSPFAKLKVLPRDGKAVSVWVNENVAYLNVVDELRRILESPVNAPPSPALTAGAAATSSAASAKRYRVQQDFDAIQKAEFAENAFATIAGYFERSCVEVHEASEHLRARYKPMDAAAFTCTLVNRAKIRGGEAHVTIRLNRARRFGGDISWLWSDHGDEGSSNGNLRVEADDFELFLAGDVSRHGFGQDRERLSPERAAEQLWDAFMRQAGIESA